MFDMSANRLTTLRSLKEPLLDDLLTYRDFSGYPPFSEITWVFYRCKKTRLLMLNQEAGQSTNKLYKVKPDKIRRQGRNTRIEYGYFYAFFGYFYVIYLGQIWHFLPKNGKK